MKTLLVLFFGILSVSMTGQEVQWSSKVLDQSSGDPLIGVNVFDRENGVGGSSDSKGKFQIFINQWPVTFTISYLGYEPQIINANGIDDLPKIIRLVQDENRLEEIVVSDKSIPKKVSKQWKSVVDFILLEERILYAETGGNFKSSKLVLADFSGNVLDEVKIAEFDFFENLYLSCRGTPFIVCEYVAIQLDLSNDKIVSQYKNNIKDFNKLVQPCKAANEDFLYHGKEYLNGEMAKITQIDLNTLEQAQVTEVYDKEAVYATKRSMEQVALYARFEEHTKNPFFERIRKKEQSNMEKYRLVVDYDVFTSGDNVLVMDHMNSEISYFDQKTNLIKKVPIYYNQEKKWTGMLKQDPVSELIYVVIRDGKSLILHQLDVESGDLLFITFLDVDSIDKLEINKNTLWYTASKLVGPEIGKRLYKLDL